ncbi:MAG: NAD(P)H-dependent oxidoreductase, partial [Alphaproteobacteria bacterium]
MSGKVLIVNGHQKWEISPGRLNRTLVERANEILGAKGYEIRNTHIEDDWDVGTEIANMVWADAVIFQFPVYWFGVPW